MSMTTKQFAAQLAQFKEEGQKGREGWIALTAEVSKDAKWSKDALEASGVGRQFLRDGLAEYHGVEPDKVSKSELSKFCTVASPSCRGKVPAIMKAAKDHAPEFGEKRDNVALKMMKHLKSGDVSTVETAWEAARAEYVKREEARSAAPDQDTPEGFIEAQVKRFDSKTGKARKLFTPESVDAVVAALRGLEAKPVETEESVEDAGEVADVLAALAGGDDSKAQAIAALVSLLK